MRDNFTQEVRRILADRVGNACSNPDCCALTSGPQDDPAKTLNLGVAAHITAAAPGGPRYDSSLTHDQRCHSDNGIWLCQNCAKLVDNDTVQFPKDLLQAWKIIAEHRARLNIGKAVLPLHAESDLQRKGRAILEWKGRVITHSVMYPPEAALRIGPKLSTTAVRVLECTEHYVTTGGSNGSRSISLEKVTICYDDANQRLELQENLV